MLRRPALHGCLALLAATTVAGCLDFFDSSYEGSDAHAAPDISFRVDEVSNRLLVNSAVSQADWHRLALRVESCDVSPPASAIVYAGSGYAVGVQANRDGARTGAALNQPMAGAHCGPKAQKQVGTATQAMQAGDFIGFCSTPGPVDNAQLTVLDTTANAVIHKAKIARVAACPG
jgi:hypothetical protein